jgi:predicted flap endonuclease-1-like 5' DNA nuclease
MIWLAAQMWTLLFIAFIIGAGFGAWIGVGRNRLGVVDPMASDLGANAPGRAAAPAILLDAPNGARDDLTQIIGIDQATEARLNDLGVFHLRQIAGWDDGAARWVEIRLNEPGRVARERWSDQAASLV